METKLLKLHQVSNKKPLTRSKDLSENLSYKLLCDVISLSCSSQYDIRCFTIAIFHLDDYHWQPNVLNHNNLKQKTSDQIQRTFRNLSLKLLCDIIFPSLPGQFDLSCFTMSNFQSYEYPWKPNFSNHIKFILKTSNYDQFHNILRLFNVLPNFPFTSSEKMRDYYL